jgi:hypothetical protein
MPMMMARHGALRADARTVATDASEGTNEEGTNDGTKYFQADPAVRALCFVISLITTRR